MTKICYDAGSLTLICKGHAGSAPKGQDLVCCAISTLTGTLISALESMSIHRCIEADEEEAFLIIHGLPCRENMTKARLIFDIIVTGLRQLASQYPQYIDFTEKFTMPKGEE